MRITLVEAGPGILGSFDAALVSYYADSLRSRGIDLKTSMAVKAVEEEGDGVHHSTLARLGDGSALPFGMMVWSAGLAPVKFVDAAGLPKVRGVARSAAGGDGAGPPASRGPRGAPPPGRRLPRWRTPASPTPRTPQRGRRGGRRQRRPFLRSAAGAALQHDEFLRVPGLRGRVFALGDCASNDDAPLPPLASVAEQQGIYLADCFNEHYAGFDPTSADELPPPGEM